MLALLGIISFDYLNPPGTEVDPESYFLGPGDVLQVVLQGKVSFTTAVAVDYNGYVDLPGPGEVKTKLTLPRSALSTVPRELRNQPQILLEKVKVSGLSLDSASKLINGVYKKFYKGTSAKTYLLKPRNILVNVTGQVAVPGFYTLSAIQRLTDALSEAGGVSVAAASTRGEGRGKWDNVVVNLYEYLLVGDETKNPMLSRATVIYVPPTQRSVQVIGAITPSSIYGTLWAETENEEGVKKIKRSKLSSYAVKVTWEEGDDVRRVLAKVGSLWHDADLSRMTVVRAGKRLSASFTTPLQPGDILEVPVMEKEIYVLGEVYAAGAFSYVPGRTYLDYVSLARPKERGYTKRFTVVKPDGRRVSVRPEDEPMPGDKIIVERVPFLWYQDYLSVVATATTILVTWLTLRR